MRSHVAGEIKEAVAEMVPFAILGRGMVIFRVQHFMQNNTMLGIVARFWD
jgi:hypothetical protein